MGGDAFSHRYLLVEAQCLDKQMSALFILCSYEKGLYSVSTLCNDRARRGATSLP